MTEKDTKSNQIKEKRTDDVTDAVAASLAALEAGESHQAVLGCRWNIVSLLRHMMVMTSQGLGKLTSTTTARTDRNTPDSLLFLLSRVLLSDLCLFIEEEKRHHYQLSGKFDLGERGNEPMVVIEAAVGCLLTGLAAGADMS